MLKIEWVLGLNQLASLSPYDGTLRIDYERWRKLPDSEKDFVLQHEQEHYKRGGYPIPQAWMNAVEDAAGGKHVPHVLKEREWEYTKADMQAALDCWKVALDQRDALDKLCTSLKKTIELKDALLKQSDERIDALREFIKWRKP